MTREQLREALIKAYDAGWSARHVSPGQDLMKENVERILHGLDWDELQPQWQSYLIKAFTVGRLWVSSGRTLATSDDRISIGSARALVKLGLLAVDEGFLSDAYVLTDAGRALVEAEKAAREAQARDVDRMRAREREARGGARPDHLRVIE
jgi:hypothetical protein